MSTKHPLPPSRPATGSWRRPSGRAVLAAGASLALAVVAGSTLGSTPAQAAFPGTNGKLACQGSINRAGSNPEAGTTAGITSINPDGSGYKLLTNPGLPFPDGPTKDDTSPAYSPDGKRIAFDGSRFGSQEVFVMNADGHGQARLTFAPGADAAPHYSPDGRQIVFTGSRVGNQFDVFKMNADGTGQTNLTPDNATASDGRASFSPDGTRIAFETVRKSATDPEGGPFNLEIATMKPDGSDVRVLTDTRSPVSHRTTRWSPDGKQIAFESNRDQPGDPALALPSNTDIYKINADGSGVKRLTTNAGTPGLAGTSGDTLPQFSPDGTKIVFNSQRDRDPNPAPGGTANQEVYIMDAEGGNERRVTNQPGDDSRCDWQPIPRVAVRPPAPVSPLPAPPIPSAGKLNTKLTLKARPRRDRRLPFRYTFSGSVRLPVGADKAKVCGGRVRLRLTKGRRTVARGVARVSKGCTYKKRITIRTTKRTGTKRGRLKVGAAFGGNAFLKGSKTRTTVRFF